MSGAVAIEVALLDPGSAVPFYAGRLAASLARQGAAVRHFCAPFPHHPLPEPDGYERQLAFARWLGHPALARLARSTAARRTGRAASYLLDWARLERRLARRPADVVHLQWPLDARCDAWWLERLRGRGARVVVTFHNARPRADAPGRRGAESRLLAAADAVVTLGASVAAEVARFAPAATRIEVIPPAVPPPASPLSRGAVRSRWGLPEEAPVALCFGLVRPYKGIDRLVEAFARVLRELPEARLVVAGLGRGASSAGLDRSLEGRLLRIDRYLPEGDAEELFAAADVVVLPYREGSASAVVLEAWRHERLPLATAVGALAEQVIDGETGRTVPAEDVEALAAALAGLLADRAGTLEAGRRAAAAARRRFAPEADATAHLALYREILRPVRAA